METPKLPSVVPVLSISPAKFEIVAAQDKDAPLAFVSPPLEDISEMLELGKNAFSLKEQVSTSSIGIEETRERLDQLLHKSRKFQNSAVFFNRLANLYALLGDMQSEESAARRAHELGGSSKFFLRKLGEGSFRREDLTSARRIFGELADRDSYSALRLASFAIWENDFDRAATWVERAVSLAPAGYAERLFQGALSLVSGEYRDAVKFLRIAIEDRPQSSVAYCNMGLAYLAMSKPERAFASFKRSAILDPFNESALLALSDVGVLLKKEEDVLSYLRYFVEFEQTSSAIWGRLARSLLSLRLFDSTIHALKRQGALQSNFSVWNNLGVAYALKNDRHSSLSAFKHALTFVGPQDGGKANLILRNTAQLVATAGDYKTVLGITRELVEMDIDRQVATDPKAGDIYCIHLNALLRLGRRAEALKLGNELLQIDGVVPSIVSWLVSAEASSYGLYRDNDVHLSRILDQFTWKIVQGEPDLRVLNNIAFAYAELDELDKATAVLSKVSFAVHKDPYVTATFGLVALRKGRRDRGEALYREAITLATSTFDKNRIRQKLNLELARLLGNEDVKRSRRLLGNVLKEKHGEPVLLEQAAELLTKLKETSN